jgi:hypothetical protein
MLRKMLMTKHAMNIAIHTLLLITYLYAALMAGYTILFGLWPASVLFIIIYLIVLSQSRQSVSLRSQITLISVTTVLLLGLLFIGGSNVSTSRAELVVAGFPTVFGLWSVFGLSCMVIFGAMGFSGIGVRISTALLGRV